MDEKSGPGYYDVDRYVECCRQEWGIGIHLVVLPPCYIHASGRKTSWTVTVRAWYLRDSSPVPVGASAAWGQGGAWRTFPQAAYNALVEFQAKLEQGRDASAQQATF